MYSTYNNKRAVETFLVNKTGVNTFVNTTSPGGDVNTVTGAVNILDGEIGIMPGDFTSNTSLNKWATVGSMSSISNIKIAQGTEDSANPNQAQQNATYPLSARPLITSGNISARGELVVTKSLYAAPTSTVWVVGDTGAVATGGVVAKDNTQYSLTIAYRGRIADKVYSSASTAY